MNIDPDLVRRQERLVRHVRDIALRAPSPEALARVRSAEAQLDAMIGMITHPTRTSEDDSSFGASD